MKKRSRDTLLWLLSWTNKKVTIDIRKAFLVYLISNNLPIHELLNAGLVITKSIFEFEFIGMTRIDIKYEELLEVKERLVSEVKTHLTDNEKKFLISFKKRKPDWDLLGLKGIEKLPSVRWKLINLKKMDAKKHKQTLNKLEKVLDF